MRKKKKKKKEEENCKDKEEKLKKKKNIVILLAKVKRDMVEQLTHVLIVIENVISAEKEIIHYIGDLLKHI